MGFTKTILNAIKYWAEQNFVLKEEIPEQVQPDWNQHDSTQDDYIKNRPFYEKASFITRIEEQTINLTSTNNFDVIVGDSLPYDYYTYRVTFDGIVYDDVEAYESGSEIQMTIQLNDEEYVTIRAELTVYIPRTLIGEHTIKIEQKIIEKKLIDSKFLPIAVYQGIDDSAVCVNFDENVASGSYSYAEGCGTTASNHTAHAEGNYTTASNFAAHAEGYSTTASGNSSHAEGYDTTASGEYSHAEGHNTTASGTSSHAQGEETTALGDSQFVYGKYSKKKYNEYVKKESYSGNTYAYGYASDSYSYDDETGVFTLGSDATRVTLRDTKSKYWIRNSKTGKEMYYVGATAEEDKKYTAEFNRYALIVGNGEAYSEGSNAHTLDWSGVGWFQGGLQVGGNAQDDGAKNVLLEGDAIPVPMNATVGQTIIVKSVDENGVPTAWESVDFPSDDHINDLINAVLATIENGT